MREIEKYYFEYIVLGMPRRAFGFFLKFAFKKGMRPTLYADKIPIWLKVIGLARGCEVSAASDRTAFSDILTRHAVCFASKKLVLIYTPQFKKFIETNRGVLEKSFLICGSEEIYEA